MKGGGAACKVFRGNDPADAFSGYDQGRRSLFWAALVASLW
jgi:hypothetical protein